MENRSIYEDIAVRTEGDIYIGVVGPVRTGKSTFIKSFMETMVLPASTTSICGSGPEMNCLKAAAERPS